MALLEQLRGYRTLVSNGTVFVVGLLVAFGVIPASALAGVTPDVVGGSFDELFRQVDTLIGSIMASIAVLNTLLRLITKGPVGQQTV